MKSKKRSIITASAVIIALAIIIAIASPFIKSGVNSAIAHRYISTDLKNANNITLIAHSIETDGEKNSVNGVKEAVRLGADAVVVDLCFRADETPVMCEKYENYLTAPTVESLFIAMNNEKYKDIKIYFNIVQLSSLSKLNTLAIKYNMLGRIFLTGIDERRYGLINSDSTIVPFLLKYKLTQEDISSIESNTFVKPECIALYGASGLEINFDDATPEAVEALNDFGIPFIVSGINSTKDFCESLSNGATAVYVNDIESQIKVLDEWIKAIQERYQNSIKQALENTKAEQ